MQNRKFHPSCDGIWCPILKFEPRIFAQEDKSCAGDMVPLTFLEQQSQHHHLLFLWFPMLETEVRRPKCSTSGCLQRHHGGWVLLPRDFFWDERFTFFKQTAGKKTSKSIDWGMRLSGTALQVRCECTGAKQPSTDVHFGGSEGRLQHLRFYLSCWFWVLRAWFGT